tara:strand:+ start:136 stop:549 length:414 start_codon:yes stop_codon:yes gene_type:complete
VVSEPSSSPEAISDPPETVETPAPLDNRIITEARIDVVGDKIAPNVYSDTPGYNARVFTAAGEIPYNGGCYAHWELFNNGTLLTTGDTSCNVQRGWSTAWWPNGTRLDNGEVRVVASISTDWGETASAEVTFTRQRS